MSGCWTYLNLTTMSHRSADDYFERRAEEERLAAANAADERAAQTHRALAARYDAKVNGGPVREVQLGDAPNESGMPKDFRILP